LVCARFPLAQATMPSLDIIAKVNQIDGRTEPPAVL
jgi:hypothetical protein